MTIEMSPTPATLARRLNRSLAEVIWRAASPALRFSGRRQHASGLTLSDQLQVRGFQFNGGRLADKIQAQ